MSQTLIPNSSRVRQAHDEVGVTKIRPRAAALFMVIFLGLLFGVGIVDHSGAWNRLHTGEASRGAGGEFREIIRDLRRQICTPAAWVTANRKMLAYMRELEEEIEEQAVVAGWLRPWAQRGLLFGGAGNEKVYPGKNNWLYYQPDVDSVSGPGFMEPEQLHKRITQAAEWEHLPQPDPLAAIIDFHQQLATRNIRLLVVPTPGKAEIVPQQFSSRFSKEDVVHNPSYRTFVEKLTAAGVWVADTASWLREYRQQEHKESFLRTDTHWTPAAMQWVTGRLAEELNTQLSWDEGPLSFQEDNVLVSNQGDIAAMLDLNTAGSSYNSETVINRQVRNPDGSRWRAHADAELLVLGDSFSNIYSLAAMGWGESGGFVEHLSLASGRLVDRIVRNDQGAVATRRLLARELARGRDRLAGKKVVLYQFANRELVFGDWQVLPLELQTTVPSTFLSLAPGEKQRVRGVVQEISSVPRPGSVPYRDHVVVLHLVDIVSVDKPGSFAQAVVFMQSMQNNTWTPAARIRPGDELELQLNSWEDMASLKSGLNRSELEDLDLQLQEPVWGEW